MRVQKASRLTRHCIAVSAIRLARPKLACHPGESRIKGFRPELAQRVRLCLSEALNGQGRIWLLLRSHFGSDQNTAFEAFRLIGSGRPINGLDSTDVFRTAAYPVSAGPFGLSRNPFFSPAFVNSDIRTMKTFYFHQERLFLQIGVEAFNLMNLPIHCASAPTMPPRGPRSPLTAALSKH